MPFAQSYTHDTEGVAASPRAAPTLDFGETVSAYIADAISVQRHDVANLRM
eukprot:COSAG02_NODE_6877_length_3312_cov_20.078743_5_plen_51_part_00